MDTNLEICPALLCSSLHWVFCVLIALARSVGLVEVTRVPNWGWILTHPFRASPEVSGLRKGCFLACLPPSELWPWGIAEQCSDRGEGGLRRLLNGTLLTQPLYTRRQQYQWQYH